MISNVSPSYFDNPTNTPLSAVTVTVLGSGFASGDLAIIQGDDGATGLLLANVVVVSSTEMTFQIVVNNSSLIVTGDYDLLIRDGSTGEIFTFSDELQVSNT